MKTPTKIKIWFIYTEYGTQAVPYILDLSNEDVNDTEIAMCIDEQVYGVGRGFARK